LATTARTDCAVASSIVGGPGTNNPSWECTVPVSHNGQWNPSLEVHCVGTAQPPTSVPWPPQDLSLETAQAAAPAL